jgi:Rod binding domain-containing protein
MTTVTNPAVPDQALAAAPSAQQQQVIKSARDFEAVFATEMLTPMFDTVQVDPTFGGGHGEEMFKTMMLDQYGKQIAASDSLGMVHQVADTLLQAQERKK